MTARPPRASTRGEGKRPAADRGDALQGALGELSEREPGALHDATQLLEQAQLTGASLAVET